MNLSTLVQPDPLATQKLPFSIHSCVKPDLKVRKTLYQQSLLRSWLSLPCLVFLLDYINSLILSFTLYDAILGTIFKSSFIPGRYLTPEIYSSPTLPLFFTVWFKLTRIIDMCATWCLDTAYTLDRLEEVSQQSPHVVFIVTIFNIVSNFKICNVIIQTCHIVLYML